MSGRPAALRRVGITLAVYLVAGGLLWWAIPAFQGLLLLPPLFGRVAKGALLVGVPLAAAVAWRFPEIGGGADAGHGD